MTAQADAPTTSDRRFRSTRPWLPPLLLNTALTVLLGLLVIGVLCTLVAETPLALLMKWYHAVILLDLAAILIAAAFFWGLRQRRLWFVGLLPIVAWILLTLMVFVSYTPANRYDGFILDCAKVKRGTSVDDFEAYMAKRGWLKRECGYSEALSERDAMGFTSGGAEVFLVYFDPQTRQIHHWRFIHD